MQRRPLLSVIVLFLPILLSAQINVQTHRTYDGKSNNLQESEWGSAGVNLVRLTTIGYADGISSPAGPNRPNPREISNGIFAQVGLVNDPMALSDYCWVFGQFIDHDIGITGDDEEEPAMIPVPEGDPWFDPFSTGNVIIPMTRNIHDPNTGTSTNNPRQHPNEITAFIDGSAVYGSDENRADWLRTFQGGKLKTSEGNLLPFNTTTGELADPIDQNAPDMANATGISDKVFVAGDVRANENPLLLGFHTMFMREHNRICDQLLNENPDWTDEEIYQHARKLVGGIIQAIIYEEWLPAMGVNLPDYSGYQNDVNPGLINVFTAAAFRLGHTLLNSQIVRMDNEGEILDDGNLLLRDGFFNPMVVIESGGIEPFIKGMATQIQQEMDNKMVNDVRNFLFGPPGAGGLDLASININRGRERGLPDFNTVRSDFGLDPYFFFQEINPNPAVFSPLLMLYSNINDIDPWVGMLSEAPMPGALFGETIMKIMETQFFNLREGDRFYYENDPLLSEDEKEWIKNTTMHDVIMRNTGIILMQDNVFDAMPHEEICENMTADLDGQILTETGLPVANVEVSLNLINDNSEFVTDELGTFAFLDIPACDAENLVLHKNTGVTNGVSTADLIRVAKHIIGIDDLDSPYKMIAADVNNSNSISTLDLIAIRRLILGIVDVFPNNNTSWRFVPASYEFIDPTNPFDEDFPEALDVGVLAQNVNKDFVGIKVGDVTENADPNEFQSDDLDTRSEEVIALELLDMEMKAGQYYTLNFNTVDQKQLVGYQLGLKYATENLRFVGFEEEQSTHFATENLANFSEEGMITISWNSPDLEPVDLGDQQTPVFSLTFEALQNISLASALSLNEDLTAAEAYAEGLEVHNLQLNYRTQTDFAVKEFVIQQNQPNPFSGETIIPFELPDEGVVALKVFDQYGKLLYQAEAEFATGWNQFRVEAKDLAAQGILYYQLATGEASATGKMLLLD